MTAGMEVKLFGMWASPAVRRVEWALKMKGVEYEYIEEDLANKSPALLEYNPINKQVPVLLHNDKAIIESLVIIEYIDETWKEKEPILPRDPYERAQARFWATFVETKFRTALGQAFVAEEGEEKQKAIKLAEDHLTAIEEVLKGKKFFGGEKVGYLDLAIGWIALWVGVSERVANFKILDPNKFSRITSWIEEFLEVRFIKDNIPDRNKTIEFFTNYRKYGFAIPKN